MNLYEKNNHIGGKVNRLEEEGFGFDLGPSILSMLYIFENLFRYSHKNVGLRYYRAFAITVAKFLY